MEHDSLNALTPAGACLREDLTTGDLGMSLRICYNCSTCSTACPVALETGGKFNPRSIIQLANCGFEDRIIIDLEPNVWDCTMCEICQEVCPQNVDLHGIFVTVKNAAAEYSNIPESYTSETGQVYQFGKAVPLQPAIVKRREQLGLPPSIDANVNEIQLLMNLSGAKAILDAVEKKKATMEESN
ncbi:MAG: 4Fe-4S dicluster domain-containing protein [Promethearchaeota archaeon]|nr:MAG: 4Fe-4S dicluster domain-containing protein [Candidatus Lokiarchaeota archaeon]